MNHDFIVSEKYAVFFRAPLKMRHWRQIFGRASVADNFVWCEDEGTEVIIVPLAKPKECIRFQVPAFWQWHFVNAYDDGDEIVVDFVRNDDFRSDKWLKDLFALKESDIHSPGLYSRARINPHTQSFKCDTVTSVPVEFPKVSPLLEGSRHQYAYTVAHADAASMRYGLQPLLAKYDLESKTSEVFSVGTRRIPSEPLFIPRTNSQAEDDGYILSVFYDIDRNQSGLAVLDAQNPGSGTLATVWYAGRMPVTFHGCWVDAR
jgi:all-trans-8'-apo-beta-carotenal 15,15'-oxygenase